MKNFILCLILGISMNVSAQFNVGIIGSQNLSLSNVQSVKIGNTQGYVTHLLTYEGTDHSNSYGLFTMYRTGHQYGRVEITYNKSKSNFKIEEYTNSRNNIRNISQKVTRLDLNIIGGLTYNQWSIGTGPIIHFNKEDADVFENISSVEQQIRKITFGFIGTIGYDIGRIHLDIRYERNFADINHGLKLNGRKQELGKTANFLKIVAGYTIL